MNDSTATPPSAAKKKESWERSRTLLLWLLAALIATFATASLTLPWKVLSPVFAVAGLVVGILVFRYSSTPGSSMWTPTAAVLGILACLFFGGGAGLQIAYWDATSEYEECIEHALTVEAKSTCEREYTENMGLPTLGD